MSLNAHEMPPSHVVVVEFDVITNGTCDDAQNMVQPYLDSLRLGGVRVVEVYETTTGLDKRVPTEAGFYYALVGGEETILQLVAVAKKTDPNSYDLMIVGHPDWDMWTMDWNGRVPAHSEYEELRRHAKESGKPFLFWKDDPRVIAAPHNYIQVREEGEFTGYYIHYQDVPNSELAWNPPAGFNRGLLQVA